MVSEGARPWVGVDPETVTYALHYGLPAAVLQDLPCITCA